MSTSTRLLTALTQSADDNGKVRATVADLATQCGIDRKETARALWALQKLSLVTFRERHERGVSVLEDIKIRRKRIAKADRMEVAFAVGAATKGRPDPTREAWMAKLREAASLLEEANEADLALLVLEAMSGKKLPTIRLEDQPAVVPGEGRRIRRLSPEEVEHVSWL